MMRSLTSAVGGLRSHQTRMDVIGNNIANVNTYGFKSSRVTFSDVYYQTLSAGSSPNSPQMGGTNPTQIGYGAAVATIDVLNSPSGQVGTDRALDIYIAGDGMIATIDGNGYMRYTRLGVLGFDAEGFLVDSNGYYVLGFPQNDDGSPSIGADGTVDANDLEPIQVDPKMLNQMTGISIGTAGEIIGVMPGDTEVNMVNGLPAWLHKITVPENSNLSGDVKVTMENQALLRNNSLVNWVTAIEAMPNQGIDGNYTFTYDTAAKTITAVSSTGDVFTGAYVRGGEVQLKNANGDIGFILATDNFTNPSATAMGTAAFDKQWVITMESTDKGGNAVKESQNYDGVATRMELGGVTIEINPGAVEFITETNFTFDYGTVSTSTTPTDFSWLKGVTIDPDSTALLGPVTLHAGKEFVSTSYLAGNSAFNWMDATVLENYLANWSENNLVDPGYTGRFNITYTETAPGVFDIDIVSENGDVAAAFTGVTPPVTGPGFALPAAFGGGNLLRAGATITSLADGTDSTIANVGVQNTIRAMVGTDVIGSTVYNSGGTVTVGDMTLMVDAAALRNFFDTGDGSGGLINMVIGTIGRGTREAWEFDAKAGTARATDGEKVIVGNIAAAKIPNMVAMTQDGKGYFLVSANSGDAQFSRPGLNGTGQTIAGYLEMSNVDISKEFTDMITTQRGFQANTRIITVSDEMLAELVNLKR